MKIGALTAGLAIGAFGVAIWLSFVSAPALVAQARESAGLSVRGQVIDREGRPVAGAVVTLAQIASDSASGHAPVLSLTTADGLWFFTGIQAGAQYEVNAEYEMLSSPAIRFRAGTGAESAGIVLRVSPAIEFQDVASRAALNFMLRNGANGHFYQPELMLGGVAVLDYNNDGCMDIFFSNGAEFPSLRKTGPEFHNHLYRNNCDMTFTDVSDKAGISGEGYSMGVAAADYDNDGYTDLLVTGVNGNTLYHNRGNGTFEDVTVRAGLAGSGTRMTPDGRNWWSVSAGWFDYDNDGYLDLFITSYVEWKPGDDNCTNESGPYYCHPRVYKPLPNRLYHNNRDGTFTDVSKSSGIGNYAGKGMGVAFGDFNGDGLIDIFVANDSVPNFLFENRGGGKFREVGVAKGVAYAFHGNAVAGMGADFRDFDDDGRDDIVMDAMYFDTFPLYRNLGLPRFFLDVTPSSGLALATQNLTGWGLGMYDFDNDGHKDLFFATSHFPGSEPRVHTDSATPNHVLRNRGDGRFDDVSPAAGGDFQLPAFHRGAAFADFDNDGRIDVVVSAVNSPARLFRNVSARSGHWIALRLEGTSSNRDGIGAKVRLTLPDGQMRYNRVTTSVGYASSSEPLVRFGLGSYDTAREIEIQWPAGRRQLLRDVKGDRVLTVQEPPAGR